MPKVWCRQRHLSINLFKKIKNLLVTITGRVRIFPPTTKVLAIESIRLFLIQEKVLGLTVLEKAQQKRFGIFILLVV